VKGLYQSSQSNMMTSPSLRVRKMVSILSKSRDEETLGELTWPLIWFPPVIEPRFAGLYTNIGIHNAALYKIHWISPVLMMG
jgi:hypothetical protein